MGMSSSQARLLNLTARMHQIEYKAARLEAMKLQMANESTRVYENYLIALDSTKIQYKSLNTDGSITYNDASYYDLCFGSAGEQYGLFAVNNGFMYVPQEIKNAFDSSSSAADFASALSNYTPPANPNPTPNPPTPSVIVPVENPNTDVNAQGQNIASGSDITMNMGESKNTTISSTPITLTLKNTFNGGDYKYTISSTGSNETVNFKYLKNGRLVIEGNNLNITATSGQNDDLILLGKSNNLNSGDGDDVIRVGYCADSSNHTKQSDSNNINAGAGNDHIEVYGKNNTINGSGGNDTTLFAPVKDQYGNIIDFGDYNTNLGIEESHSGYINTIGKIDGIDGWANQGDDGDCRLLALINSLGKNTNNGLMTSYVQITQSGDNYNVTFPKYTGGTNSTTVTKSEILSCTGVYGDLDTVITDIALNKLIANNTSLQKSSGRNQNVATADYNVLSDYIFGNKKITWLENSGTTNWTQFNNLFNQYQSGAISNLSVSFNTTNNDLGIISGHAFSVKNITSEYVEVVNPWDDEDSLKLDINTFRSYAADAYVFGSGSENIIYTNAGSSFSANEENKPYLGVGSNLNDAQKYEYFVNMYNAIKAAGGCEIVPDNMIQNKDWLVNIINGGFAYLKVVNKNNREWVDTSVSTNTGLQEISNEVLLKKAEAKYEADMKRIDLKDRKYDTDLAALDTERNAIKQEMETLKTVSKDNVERTFKLFS